ESPQFLQLFQDRNDALEHWAPACRSARESLIETCGREEEISGATPADPKTSLGRMRPIAHTRLHERTWNCNACKGRRSACPSQSEILDQSLTRSRHRPSDPPFLSCHAD